MNVIISKFQWNSSIYTCGIYNEQETSMYTQMSFDPNINRIYSLADLNLKNNDTDVSVTFRWQVDR